MYRRTGFNCNCLIIVNCKVLFRMQLLQSQNALLLYMRMRKPYVNAIIFLKMLKCNYFVTQLQPVLRYCELLSREGS